MVSDTKIGLTCVFFLMRVLILVVMEYGLRHTEDDFDANGFD